MSDVQSTLLNRGTIEGYRIVNRNRAIQEITIFSAVETSSGDTSDGGVLVAAPVSDDSK